MGFVKFWVTIQEELTFCCHVLQLQTKVQTLKNTRDYSFLLSDDADVPAPAKVPPARRVSVPQSGEFLL